MCCRPIASHEVEKKQSALRYVRIETAVALACSFLINLFIVSVFAKVCRPYIKEWCRSVLQPCLMSSMMLLHKVELVF